MQWLVPNYFIDSINKTTIDEFDPPSGADAEYLEFHNEINLEGSVSSATTYALVQEASHAVHDYYSGSTNITIPDYEKVQTITQSVAYYYGGNTVLGVMVRFENLAESIKDPSSPAGKAGVGLHEK